jgi:hypothetical protein
MWGKAEFGLKPIELSDDRKKLTVQFFWFKRGSFSERMPLTKAPVLLTTGRAGPRDTKVFNCLTEEVICSGDFVTLEVQDPDQYPLPSFELLEMQWTLHMVAAISGAAEAPDDPYDPELDDVTEEELSDIFFDEVDDPTLFLAQRREVTEVSPFRHQILSENQPPVETHSPVRQTGKHSPVKGRSPARGNKQT